MTIRVGLIGAGYIAAWHAEALIATPDVELTAICDVSAGAAEALAASYGTEAYSSVDDLIGANICDAVHILTPPHLHHDLAIRCLGAGLHVLVEKPVAMSGAETRAIQAAADAAGKRFSAGHNFMGQPSYLRLREAVQSGRLGRVSEARIDWNFPLAPLRSGPYGLWLLREPRNLLLELGPHLVGFAHDLFGDCEVTYAELSHPVALPGDDIRHQGWRILARAGDVNLSFNLSLVETVDDRSVSMRGSSGRARFDYAADTLVIDRENASDLVLNPLRRQLDQSWQHLREGAVNAARQVSSLNAKSPYGLSFRGMCGAVYEAIAEGRDPDPRFSGLSAVRVMDTLDTALAKIPAKALKEKTFPKPKRKPKPTAMVIGGTGFIGRALTRKLVAAGRDVRVLSRGTTGPFPDLQDRVETVGVSLRDKDGLINAMEGMDVVYNLARSLEKTWDAALENDVGVAINIAEAAQASGVKRLVYTGTIASYDMSDPHRKITEETAFPEDMSDRNLYARSKAECEARLMEMHRRYDLPLTIARPGIVIGPGGPLQHWGIGRWHGAGAVRIWGHGRNKLPFVLNDDVAEGLIAMAETEAAIGESFNLVGDPMMSARDYFDEIAKRLGARIRVSSGNLYAFYGADAVKYLLKKHALRRDNLVRPSLADWKSRAHFSTFDNAKPKRMLGWTPETDRDRFVDSGIVQAGLFGF